MAINGNKAFKTLDEQKTYLTQTKNIMDSPLIKRVLSERSYVSIINPYKKIFAKGKDDHGHVYFENIDINDYIEMATLDDSCSTEIFKWIGIFERKLKWVLAYEISKHLNQEGDFEGIGYVKHLSDYFDTNDSHHLQKMGLTTMETFYSKNGISEANAQYMELRRQLFKGKMLLIGNNNKRSKNNLVRHYQVHHRKVPFWLLVHDLTIGDLQLLYNSLSKDMRRIVTQHFHYDNPTPKQMFRFSARIETIRRIRNVISHNEPLFGYLQDKHDNELQQIYRAIDHLKQVYNESLVPSASIAKPDELEANEFNRRSIGIYKRLFDTLTQ